MVYEARPGACGINCVEYAVVESAERALGGPIGPSSKPGVSVTQTGQRSGQGELIKFMKNVAEGKESAAPVPEAIGPAVASDMSQAGKGWRVLKWGGRVFLVFGVVMTGYEIASAPKEERERTAVGAISGFVGGLAAGAAAGLVCGPGAPVCSLVAGLALGFAGAFGSRAVAEGLYDIANPRGVRVTDEKVINKTLEDLAAAEHKSPCPSCHKSMADIKRNTMTFTVFPRSTKMTSDEISLLKQYLESSH
jgi:hypothetical protein